MLSIDIAEVESFCLGTKSIPDKAAKELEDFVDWSLELSDTHTKRELAKKHLNKPD